MMGKGQYRDGSARSRWGAPLQDLRARLWDQWALCEVIPARRMHWYRLVCSLAASQPLMMDFCCMLLGLLESFSTDWLIHILSVWSHCGFYCWPSSSSWQAASRGLRPRAFRRYFCGLFLSYTALCRDFSSPVVRVVLEGLPVPLSLTPARREWPGRSCLAPAGIWPDVAFTAHTSFVLTP